MKNVDRALALAAQIMETDKKADELLKMSAELRAEFEALLVPDPAPTPTNEPVPATTKNAGGRPPRPEKEVDAKILAVLSKGPEYVTYIAKEAKVSPRTAKASLERLWKRKKVKETDTGWTLT